MKDALSIREQGSARRSPGRQVGLFKRTLQEMVRGALYPTCFYIHLLLRSIGRVLEQGLKSIVRRCFKDWLICVNTSVAGQPEI